MLEVDLFGAIHGARAVVPIFRRQRRGTLVNVGSLLSQVGNPFVPRCCAWSWPSTPTSRCLAQPSRFDPTRAPPGRHTAWAYCHVPNGSMLEAMNGIEAHVERFAPGFRDVILARSTRSAVEMERYNPSYVGGDINGGRAELGQLFTRPVARLDPYSTPAPDVFLCSSSTPPGGGVHGMCGYWCARSMLARALA